MTLVPFIIIAFYVLAIFCLLQAHTADNSTSCYWVSLIIGLCSHFWLAANTSYVQHSFNFSVASMTIWASVLISAAFAIGSLFYAIKNLAVITLPVSILCIVFALIWGDQVTLISQKSSLFYWHIAISMVAFTLLGLAVMQAILFSYQEVALRKRIKNNFLTWLPPIQTMEQLLFKTIGVGFAALTLAITLGALYNYESGAAIFGLNHHTILTVLSWVCFAVLLYGRIKLGWRGMKVIIWTLVGFSLLKLGYFGTKIISEFLAR